MKPANRFPFFRTKQVYEIAKDVLRTTVNRRHIFVSLKRWVKSEPKNHRNELLSGYTCQTKKRKVCGFLSILEKAFFVKQCIAILADRGVFGIHKPTATAFHSGWRLVHHIASFPRNKRRRWSQGSQQSDWLRIIRVDSTMNPTRAHSTWKR